MLHSSARNMSILVTDFLCGCFDRVFTSEKNDSGEALTAMANDSKKPIDFRVANFHCESLIV